MTVCDVLYSFTTFAPGGDNEPLARAILAALRSSESDNGIDVERLRRAVFNIDHATPGVGWIEDVAAEYARLSTPRTETSE